MKALVTFLFGLVSTLVLGQIPRPITHEMNRYQVNTVLLFESSGIDYRPVWSANGQEIIFNYKNRWVKMDLNHVTFITGEWLHQTIGINKTEVLDSVFNSDFDRIAIENDQTVHREVKTSKGIRYELQQTANLTTRFIRHKGKKSWVIWETGGDNCHSISLSPDEHFVSFISESNGVMIYCLDEGTYNYKIPESAKLINKALELFQKKDSPKVEHLLNRAYHKDTTSAEAIVWKAYLKMYVGKRDDAVRLMNRAITRNTKNANYFFFRAQILYTAGDVQGAIDSYTYYNQLKPYDSHGYYELGLIYEAKGESDLACVNFALAKKYYSSRAIPKLENLCH